MISKLILTDIFIFKPQIFLLPSKGCLEKNSLLISALYHFQVMNPAFPAAQPWRYSYVVIAAVIIVWMNRQTMIQRGAGVTEVLMPEKTSVLTPKVDDMANNSLATSIG